MSNDDRQHENKRHFLTKIISFTACLIVVAGSISLCSGGYFGIFLFSLGMFTAIIGMILGKPVISHDPDNPKIGYTIHSLLNHRSIDKNKYDYLQQPAPAYGFENALLFAGWIAVFVSVPFLAYIMFW